jgi:dihydroorotase
MRSLVAGSTMGGLTITSQSALAQRRNETVFQETGIYDLLLKNGHVIDPGNNINQEMTDIAVAEKKIAMVGRNIPADQAKVTIDVSGMYISPGFVDIHVHGFFNDPLCLEPGYRWVILDDMCYPSGVTTAVDTGSSGAGNFPLFKKALDKMRTRIFALLNISYPGMKGGGEQDPSTFRIEPMVEMAKTYPDRIAGFKTAHYWTGQPYDSVHTPWASVDALVEAGRKASLPVMFDFNPRPPSGSYPARSYRELILERGRPGDIHTHVFAAHIPTIQPDGKINPDLFKARERGFIFDVGHGAGSFVYKHAIPAIKQGFLPDSISTDLHGDNTCGPVVNMANVMSKIMNIGVPLDMVIRLSTVNPAREINHPELGTLSIGNIADIAVFEVLNGSYSWVDTSGGRNYGDKKIQNIMTIAGGSPVFDPAGLSYPCWENIPKNSRYWNPPVQPW